MIEDNKNDKNNIMSDDEYQFPKEEYVQASATASTEGHADDDVAMSMPSRGGVSRFAFMKNKKFIFVGAIVVVIITGLVMMHGRPQSTAKQQAAQPQQPNLAQQRANAALNQVSQLQSSQVSTKDTLSNLQAHVNTLHQQLGAANVQNAQLTSAVKELASQVTLLTNVVKSNTAKLQPKVKKIDEICSICKFGTL